MYSADRNNPWLTDVQGAGRRWRGSVALISAAIFSIAVLELFVRVGPGLALSLSHLFRNAPGVWPDVLASGALQLIIFGLFFAAAFLATRLDRRLPWPRRETSIGVDALVGLAIGGGGFLAAVALASGAGGVVPDPVGVAGPLGAVAVSALVVAVQASSEEAFFRGWLQPVLARDWGPWLGVLASAAVFAALHVFAGVHDLGGGNAGLAVVNIFLGGLLFGLLALRTGGLAAPAAAHFGWNWAESGLVGLAGDPAGSLFTLKFAGQPLWNGGAETMNGSLATTIVLIALDAGLALAASPRNRASAAPV